MKQLIYLWLCIIYFFSHLTHAEPLAEKLDTLIQKELPHATIGLLVKDAQTGNIIYSRNADKLLSPASNVKLFTAAASLYHLKSDYRFLTTLSQKNQNIYLTFSGSPSLTVANFIDLLMNLKENNTKEISGDIILDTSHFKAPYYASGVSYDDLGWYYSAPDTAAILNENAEIYQLTSAKKLGLPPLIKPKTADNQLTLINQLITVSKEDEKQHCNLNIEIQEHNTLRLFGCVAQTKQPKEIQLAIPDPVLMVKQIIKKALKDNEITLKGQIINGIKPDDAELIASYQSDPMSQLVTRMLRESDNLYANSLTKELGFSLTKEGSYKQGMFAIKKILKEHTNIDMSQIELTDGMGTRYNLATPEQIVRLLTSIYNDKSLKPMFLTALPQAGVSGTLKDRMKKTSLESQVFAKTGTMHDISSLSGYIVIPKGRSLVFSIIINGVNKPISVAKSLEEKILLTIVETLSEEPEVHNDFG